MIITGLDGITNLLQDQGTQQQYWAWCNITIKTSKLSLSVTPELLPMMLLLTGRHNMVTDVQHLLSLSCGTNAKTQVAACVRCAALLTTPARSCRLARTQNPPHLRGLELYNCTMMDKEVGQELGTAATLVIGLMLAVETDCRLQLAAPNLLPGRAAVIAGHDSVVSGSHSSTARQQIGTEIAPGLTGQCVG
jgi:ribosomal protein L40E